ncbi:MAG: arylamine N-acetyltransferase family protein [Vicinamibacteria bacterium]
MRIEDYLSRIGANAPRRLTAEALRSLHERHLRKVPFENLDIYRGVPIVLDEERILNKIVRDRRGGFCYELNFAFQWLLVQLGYRVTLLSAEVARSDGGFGIPFDHMALLVAIDGDDWLADVGFGDSFLRPLRLTADLPHPESAYVYRLSRAEDIWVLSRAPTDGEEFGSQYRFTLTPRRLSDFRGGCEYHQTSKDSPFTQRVVTSRALAEGRITLTRERLILHSRTGRTETPIPDESAWLDALGRHFEISLEVS